MALVLKAGPEWAPNRQLEKPGTDFAQVRAIWTLPSANSIRQLAAPASSTPLWQRSDKVAVTEPLLAPRLPRRCPLAARSGHAIPEPEAGDDLVGMTVRGESLVEETKELPRLAVLPGSRCAVQQPLELPVTANIAPARRGANS